MPESYAHTARRPLAIAGHSIYTTLLPIPIICFVAALVADILYTQAPHMMWLDFASWLLLAGLIAGGVAGLVLIVELVRAPRRTGALLIHFLLLFAAWVLEILNSFFHARDGWTAVVPGGLTLSILAVAASLAAGWFWQSYTANRIGV